MTELRENVVKLAKTLWSIPGDIRVSFAPPVKGTLRCGVLLVNKEDETEEQIWGAPQKTEEDALKALLNKLSLMRKEE